MFKFRKIRRTKKWPYFIALYPSGSATLLEAIEKQRWQILREIESDKLSIRADERNLRDHELLLAEYDAAIQAISPKGLK
jgi:hypothetical protein